jgi:polar amino acid transport system permease protein
MSDELWDMSYAVRILPDLLAATWVTVLVTVLAGAIALSLGLLFALARRSRIRAIAWVTASVIEFIRATPPLVQLYVLFYVLPEFGIVWSGMTVGVVGLGVHFATYASESYRAGIESVAKGQWDAAVALNLPTRRTWVAIIVPQAFRAAVPSLANYIVGLFKDSALVAVVTVTELMRVALTEANETFRYIEPLTIAALIYFLLSNIAAFGVSRLERHLARSGK